MPSVRLLSPRFTMRSFLSSCTSGSAPADQMPGRCECRPGDAASHPASAVCSPRAKRVQGGPLRRGFGVDALFLIPFCPFSYLPMVSTHTSQHSRSRNPVIGWAEGLTPDKAPCDPTESLWNQWDLAGAAFPSPKNQSHPCIPETSCNLVLCVPRSCGAAFPPTPISSRGDKPVAKLCHPQI